MNLRIITMVAVMAGLSLAACGDHKATPPEPLNCQAADGSAIPCPAAGGSAHTDGAPEQQK